LASFIISQHHRLATMENQLIMEKENSVWTKTQLLVFYVVILLAIDEYVW
jgi:hypothetical protein